MFLLKYVSIPFLFAICVVSNTTNAMELPDRTDISKGILVDISKTMLASTTQLSHQISQLAQTCKQACSSYNRYLSGPKGTEVFTAELEGLLSSYAPKESVSKDTIKELANQTCTSKLVEQAQQFSKIIQPLAQLTRLCVPDETQNLYDCAQNFFTYAETLQAAIEESFSYQATPIYENDISVPNAIQIIISQEESQAEHRKQFINLCDALNKCTQNIEQKINSEMKIARKHGCC